MEVFSVKCVVHRNVGAPTSVFGMLPLVLFPGAGSELYKGLGSVILGGLSLSAVLTLLIVPPMLKLFLQEKEVIK